MVVSCEMFSVLLLVVIVARLLARCSKDSNVTCYDATSGVELRLLETLVGHKAPVTSVEFNQVSGNLFSPVSRACLYFLRVNLSFCFLRVVQLPQLLTLGSGSHCISGVYCVHFCVFVFGACVCVVCVCSGNNAAGVGGSGLIHQAMELRVAGSRGMARQASGRLSCQLLPHR